MTRRGRWIRMARRADSGPAAPAQRHRPAKAGRELAARRVRELDT